MLHCSHIVTNGFHQVTVTYNTKLRQRLTAAEALSVERRGAKSFLLRVGSRVVYVMVSLLLCLLRFSLSIRLRV